MSYNDIHVTMVGDLRSGMLRFTKDERKNTTDEGWLVLEKRVTEEADSCMEQFEEVCHRFKEKLDHNATAKVARDFLECFKGTKCKSQRDVVNFLKKLCLRLKKFYFSFDEDLRYAKEWEGLLEGEKDALYRSLDLHGVTMDAYKSDFPHSVDYGIEITFK